MQFTPPHNFFEFAKCCVALLFLSWVYLGSLFVYPIARRIKNPGLKINFLKKTFFSCFLLLLANWIWFAWVCIFRPCDVILGESVVMLGILLNLIGLFVSVWEFVQQLILRKQSQG